jgi:hypothetical protein
MKTEAKKRTDDAKKQHEHPDTQIQELASQSMMLATKHPISQLTNKQAKTVVQTLKSLQH